MENLMDKQVSKSHGYQEASIVGALIGLLIGIILIFNAVLPSTQTAISAAGLSGNMLTLANTVITLVILLPIVWIGNMYG